MHTLTHTHTQALSSSLHYRGTRTATVSDVTAFVGTLPTEARSEMHHRWRSFNLPLNHGTANLSRVYLITLCNDGPVAIKASNI